MLAIIGRRLGRCCVLTLKRSEFSGDGSHTSFLSDNLKLFPHSCNICTYEISSAHKGVAQMQIGSCWIVVNMASF